MNTLPVADIEVAYADRGTGRPVLLVHGFPLDHTMWDAQIAALSATHRVIAPDLRGFGRTPLAKAETVIATAAAEGVSMESHADDLAGLLDALGITEPVVLAGFSMGGYIAWQFIRKYRDRLAGLVLCDTRAAADTTDGRTARLEMADNVATWGASRVAEMMTPNLFAAASIKNRPTVVAKTQHVITATAPATIAAAQRGMAARPDVTPMLAAIDLPTLVLVGEQDAISRAEEMQSVAATIPAALFAVIENAGHMAPVENPTAVSDAITTFLNRVE